MSIDIGYRLEKPIETQEDCDKYSAMIAALNEHNDSAKVGESLWSITEDENGYEIIADSKVASDPLENYKETKITESKEVLSEYLASHPLLWSDGKYYSVTSEKQSLLTSNLALYQVATTAGIPFKLTWNSTGDECVEWKYEDLAALALAIGTYVKPFVSYQQELELAIKACTTGEELSAIDISYDTILEQYLDSEKEVVS